MKQIVVTKIIAFGIGDVYVLEVLSLYSKVDLRRGLVVDVSVLMVLWYVAVRG